MRGIKKDVRQSHPAGCRCQTGRSKSQVVKRFCYVKTNAILLRDSVYPSRFVFLFWPDTLVVIGQFVIGASLLVVRPWCQNTVQVKRQGLLLTDMQRYSRERERERIDLSGCTCMESESRTLEESWSPYAILFTSKFFVFVLHFLALSAWRLPWVSWSWPTDI